MPSTPAGALQTWESSYKQNRPLLAVSALFVPHTAAGSHTPTFTQRLSTLRKHTFGEVCAAVSAQATMAKTGDLKTFLESSLNEIFKATVSDILDSVDRTLSEYQGTIQRIESENEGLKRLLFAQTSTESAPGGMVTCCRS